MLNACHPPSPLLFSVPLVSIRLTRLWTVLCPVSMVLGQPALRAARKVMFTPRTQSTFVRCSCCFNLYNSQLHLSPPLRFRGAARACSFSVSRCGCLGRRNSRGRGEFQCIQLGYWVDGCFGGAGLTVFSCGKHKHTVVQSVLVVQTHTNRLSHFSFSPPANFLHLLFFLPANSFCICFLSLLSASLSQQSIVCSHFFHTCLTHLQQHPGCFSLLCSTESLTTFSFVRLNVPSLGKS